MAGALFASALLNCGTWLLLATLVPGRDWDVRHVFLMLVGLVFLISGYVWGFVSTRDRR